MGPDELQLIVPPAPAEVADRLWEEWRARSTVELSRENVIVDQLRGRGPTPLRRYWVRGLPPLDVEDLISRVADLGGEYLDLVDRHLVGSGGTIEPERLIEDARVLAVADFETRHNERLGQLLADLAAGLERGDAVVQRLVATHFVQDSLTSDAGPEAFVLTWPEPLRNEAERR